MKWVISFLLINTDENLHEDRLYTFGATLRYTFTPRLR